MLYQGEEMEKKGLLDTASRMCVAARTAPKTKGIDDIVTLVLTDEEKENLADKMVEFGNRVPEQGISGWYERDASNLRASQAVVLIGTRKHYRGVAVCGLCGFENCEESKAAGATCGFMNVDLGISLASAVKIAAEDNVDNRIMWSVGKAAAEMNYVDEDIIWVGIPLSVAGKNVFFDRK